jgi:hypothetical protein
MKSITLLFGGALKQFETKWSRVKENAQRPESVLTNR